MVDQRTLNNILNYQNDYLTYNELHSIENDVQFSSDDRVWTSNIEDVVGGDNFADYCEYFFKLLDEEDYFES